MTFVNGVDDCFIKFNDANFDPDTEQKCIKTSQEIEMDRMAADIDRLVSGFLVGENHADMLNVISASVKAYMGIYWPQYKLHDLFMEPMTGDKPSFVAVVSKPDEDAPEWTTDAWFTDEGYQNLIKDLEAWAAEKHETVEGSVPEINEKETIDDILFAQVS